MLWRHVASRVSAKRTGRFTLQIFDGSVLQNFPVRCIKGRQANSGPALARTMALQLYDPKEHPRDLARQYDKSQRPPPAAKKPAK